MSSKTVITFTCDGCGKVETGDKTYFGPKRPDALNDENRHRWQPIIVQVPVDQKNIGWQWTGHACSNKCIQKALAIAAQKMDPDEVKDGAELVAAPVDPSSVPAAPHPGTTAPMMPGPNGRA